MTIITVNSYSVENCEDQILLSKLLEAHKTAHNGDNDIELNEAKHLVDPNMNGLIDDYELEAYFAHGLTMRDLQRASQIFYKNFNRPQPWFQENEICLAKGADKIATGAILLFDDKSAKNALLRIAQPALVKNIDKFKDSPFAKEVVQMLANENSNGVITNIELFMDMSWSEDVVMTMAKKDPYQVLKYAYLFIDKNWGEKAVEAAVMSALKKDPEIVVDFLYRFIDRPWAKDVMMSVAKKIPWYVMVSAKTFITRPWALDVLKTAKENDPEAAQRILYSQRNLPWAKDKIKELF